jgi:hypothetical protein
MENELFKQYVELVYNYLLKLFQAIQNLLDGFGNYLNNLNEICNKIESKS